MKIEKVNENQIRCTLTREDLASRELKISELAYGTEKAKNLFRDMMRQANFEFGFEAEDIPLMIEAIPLNAECIVLIITKVEDPEELDTRFSRFAPSVTEDGYDEDMFGEYAGNAPDDVLDLFRRIQTEDTVESASADGIQNSQANGADSERTRVFMMPSLQQVMNAASVIAGHYSGFSCLYKDERTNNYLLLLTQGQENSADFDRTCNIISEYGAIQRTASASSSFLAEHYEALISSNAVQALGNPAL